MAQSGTVHTLHKLIVNNTNHSHAINFNKHVSNCVMCTYGASGIRATSNRQPANSIQPTPKVLQVAQNHSLSTITISYNGCSATIIKWGKTDMKCIHPPI